MRTLPRGVLVMALAGLLTTGLAAASVASAGDADARLNAQDRLFLRGAHQGHLTELSAARIAQRKATTPTVRELAARWITDHIALDRTLTQAAIALDVVLPAGPDATQQAVLARYRAAPAAEFDELWVSTQLTAHHQATALIEAELRAGSSVAVQTLARAARPVVAAHHRALTDAGPAVGAVVPAEENAPRPGAVRTAVPTPSSAPPPRWRVTESPGTPGWTRPSPFGAGTTLSPIPIPAGPGPSLTVGAR